jgi:two-component sensor histidine kinase/PAS domain-containing protein
MRRLQHLMSGDFGVRSFVVAAAIMAVAVAARAWLDTALPGTPAFITLYPAVALAALLSGPWAGGVAALIGVAAADFFWIPPRLSFGPPSLTDTVAILLFAVASTIILFAGAMLRAELVAATVAKHALDLGLHAGGVGTWEINLATSRITASRTARALHGLPQDNRRTVPDDWLRGVHPDDAATARAALQAAVAEGGQASYSYRVIGGADGPRWISARGRVIASGGERRLVCALVDITEQVRVQDELRRERERLRLALEAGSLAVWDYDTETGEAKIGTRYAVTLGFPPDVGTLTRAQIGARIHPQDRPRVVAEHEASIATGSDYQIEYRIVTPSGDTRWLVSQGAIIAGDPAPGPVRMVGIIQDITDRKRREDELRALAEARELLIREADHRIKNSLNLVTSLLTMQLRGIRDTVAADALRGAIARVGVIAASHLALQGSKDFTTVDFAATLREICAHFAALQPAIAIVCRPCPVLMLDTDRAIPLGLAVSELLTNALRHGFPDRPAGTVSVEASAEPSALVVRVRDDGIGMAPQATPDGLGTRIIRSLVGQLAATMEVASTPQAGTTVTLRLPLKAEAETPPQDSARSIAEAS